MYAVIVAVTFLLVVFFFVRYDMNVQRRNNKLIADAARSAAVVTSLFPGAMHDKVLQSTKVRTDTLTHSGVAASKRLTTFLSSDEGALKQDGQDQGDKPLAELFLDCTVMFADVSAFMHPFTCSFYE